MRIDMSSLSLKEEGLPSSNDTLTKTFAANDPSEELKEQFRIFVRLLLKYLAMKDTRICTKAKNAIKECHQKRESGDPNFNFTVRTLRVHLRKAVGDYYWLKANQLFTLFLQQRQEKKQAGAARTVTTAAKDNSEGSKFQSKVQSRDAIKLCNRTRSNNEEHLK